MSQNNANVLIHQRGRQRTDSTHVLAAVRVLNRLERVGETMRATLNDLAVIAPEWLQALALPEWYARSGRRAENDHLPKTDAAPAGGGRAHQKTGPGGGAGPENVPPLRRGGVLRQNPPTHGPS